MEKEQNKANSGKKQDEYYDIFLTDIQIHSTIPRKLLPWDRAIFRSLRNKKPGRFYTTHFEVNKQEGSISEKREFLGMLENKLILKDRRIYIENRVL